MIDSKKFTSIYHGLVIALIVIFVLNIAQVIIIPFLIAVFLSFILDKIVQLLIRIKIPKVLAVTITIILTFVLFYLIGLVIYSSAKSFSTTFPFYEMKIKNYLDTIQLSIESILGQNLNLTLEQVDWFSAIKDFSITSRVLSSIGSFLNFFWNAVLVLIFIVYLLLGKDNLQDKIQRAFDSDNSKKLIKIIENITKQIQIYLGTKTLVSFLTAFGSFIIFVSFGLDFAILWAFLIFAFNFIPNFGSIVASVLPVTIALIQFDSLWAVFWMAILVIVIQFAMGNIIEPKLMGTTLNLSPLMVILFLIFWGWLWGIPGMILAVPILATLSIVFENIDSLYFISVFLRGK